MRLIVDRGSWIVPSKTVAQPGFFLACRCRRPLPFPLPLPRCGCGKGNNRQSKKKVVRRIVLESAGAHKGERECAQAEWRVSLVGWDI